jgi:DNA repair exonuclease SbcCD nuclease subunit
VAVLGVTHESTVLLADYGLEVWGEAHRDYNDMAPLRAPPPPRRTRWQVAMGHGHYETPENLATPLRPSWLFSDPEIAATGADYLALGHWDRAMRVGCGAVPAYYSGSPDLAKTVNVIRLGEGAHVTREALRR